MSGATRPEAPPDAYRLRLPGPIAVPERVRQATARPIVSHRGPEFRQLFKEVVAGLQPILGTRNEVHLLAASGAGAMEAAILNVVAPGERLLVVNNGQWGERFVVIGKTLGAVVDSIDVPWGENVDPAVVEARLKAASYRAVVAVHNESSTGTLADLATIGAIVRRHPALLVTDSVSGVAGAEMRQDEWGVDIVVAGSQKALMCPPGLALASISDKAWAVIERDTVLPRLYFDLRRSRTAYAKGETTFTPPVSLVQGLAEALRMIQEEGLARVLARHGRLSAAMKAGAAAMGLANFATSELQSPTVAAFHVPAGIEGGAIIRDLYERHRTVIAGARNRLQGRQIRIGTMGALSGGDILTDLLQFEDVMARLGHRFERGASLGAAATVLSTGGC
jgi:aspartate aminotransferase-like enzyme